MVSLCLPELFVPIIPQMNIVIHTYVYDSELTEAVIVVRTRLPITVQILQATGAFHFAVILLPYLPTPPLGQDMTQGKFLSGV